MQLAVALLLLLLLAATPVSSSAPSPPTPPTEQLTPAEGERDYRTTKQDESGPPIVPPAQSSSPKPTTDNGNQIACNYYCQAAATDWTLATVVQWVPTFLVALFTGGLWWTSIKQWRALRDTVEKGETALRLEQRAWLIPTDDIVVNDGRIPVSSVNPIEIEFPILNAGHMPALDVRLRMQWSRRDWGAPAPDQKTTFGENVDRDDLNVTMIGPGLLRALPISTANRKATAGEVPTKDEIAEQTRLQVQIARVLNGGPDELRLWLYGFIEYRDGFGLPEPYRTTFSFYWKPAGAFHKGQFIMSGPYNHCT